MFLRIVRTTIAPGKEAAYWEWSRKILDLWDDHGIIRAGGPYSSRNADGLEVASWLTVHKDEESARSDFRAMYSTERGQALIAQRPELVAGTDSSLHADWDQSGTAPAEPSPNL